MDRMNRINLESLRNRYETMKANRPPNPGTDEERDKWYAELGLLMDNLLDKIITELEFHRYNEE